MKSKHYSKETIREIGMYDRNFPAIEIGDTVAVSQRIKEGGKERLQVFEGTVIAKHNNGVSSSFTVRKISANAVAVERIYPYYSPLIESVKFVNKGRIRRAKLYYLRKRVGKAALVEEKIMTREQREQKSLAQNSSETK